MTHVCPGAPLMRPRNLNDGNMQLPMPGRHEAFLVTSSYPIKEMALIVESLPDEGGERMALKTTVVPLPLAPSSAAFIDQLVRQFPEGAAPLAGKCKTNVLLWNCSGTCLCEYRDTIHRLRRDRVFDVAVIACGREENERTDPYWTTLGLDGMEDLSFGEGRPAVTVRWDPTIVEVRSYIHEEAFRDGTKLLDLRVKRLWFDSYISMALYVPANGLLSPDLYGE